VYGARPLPHADVTRSHLCVGFWFRAPSTHPKGANLDVFRPFALACQARTRCGACFAPATRRALGKTCPSQFAYPAPPRRSRCRFVSASGPDLQRQVPSRSGLFNVRLLHSLFCSIFVSPSFRSVGVVFPGTLHAPPSTFLCPPRPRHHLGLPAFGLHLWMPASCINAR